MHAGKPEVYFKLNNTKNVPCTYYKKSPPHHIYNKLFDSLIDDVIGQEIKTEIKNY